MFGRKVSSSLLTLPGIAPMLLTYHSGSIPPSLFVVFPFSTNFQSFEGSPLSFFLLQYGPRTSLFALQRCISLGWASCWSVVASWESLQRFFPPVVWIVCLPTFGRLPLHSAIRKSMLVSKKSLSQYGKLFCLHHSWPFSLDDTLYRHPRKISIRILLMTRYSALFLEGDSCHSVMLYWDQWSQHTFSSFHLLVLLAPGWKSILGITWTSWL